jgi:hypothetical protein
MNIQTTLQPNNEWSAIDGDTMTLIAIKTASFDFAGWLRPNQGSGDC